MRTGPPPNLSPRVVRGDEVLVCFMMLGDEPPYTCGVATLPTTPETERWEFVRETDDAPRPTPAAASARMRALDAHTLEVCPTQQGQPCTTLTTAGALTPAEHEGPRAAYHPTLKRVAVVTDEGQQYKPPGRVEIFDAVSGERLSQAPLSDSEDLFCGDVAWAGDHASVFSYMCEGPAGAVRWVHGEDAGYVLAEVPTGFGTRIFEPVRVNNTRWALLDTEGGRLLIVEPESKGVIHVSDLSLAFPALDAHIFEGMNHAAVLPDGRVVVALGGVLAGALWVWSPDGSTRALHPPKCLGR